MLNDDEIIRLAQWAKRIGAHFDRPMDIEWAKDGAMDDLFILQARPETVQSQKKAATMVTYTLQETGEQLLTGLAIGQLIPAAHEADNPVGICGQAPTDYPEFAAFLVRCGIDSISLNPDSVIDVTRRVAEVEVKAERP